MLTVLVPLTMWIAIAEWLPRDWGWLLALPLGFLALQFLPFFLRAKSPRTQWLVWFTLGTGWAIWRRQADGAVGVIAYLWIAMAVMNLAAWIVLLWRWTLRWQGKPGLVWRLFLLVISHAAAIAVGYFHGWIWALLGGAGIAAFYCWEVLNPYRQGLGPVVCKTEAEEILITLDDGPDPVTTPAVLDLLDRYQTRAIFFLIGEKALAHPELTREIVRRGHEIGNHTQTHPQASFWIAGPWRTRREITECQQAIQSITGQSPRWFRAPVGHRNFFTHPVTRALGLEIMGWNRRGFDAVEKDSAKVLNRILPDLRRGDIVLLHEATPIATEVLEGVLKGQSMDCGGKV